MAMKKKEEKKTLYPVRCTECGELIENKFFPLDRLLDQYYNGQGIAAAKKQIISAMGIGVQYGQPLLPQVPQLLIKGEEEEGYQVQMPDLQQIRSSRNQLRFFSCDDNEIQDQPLVPLKLNIASIVAQFYLMSGFDTIYLMLQLQKKIENMMYTGENPAALQGQLDVYCDLFANLPYVNLGTMATDMLRRQATCQILSSILTFAKVEADRPGEDHFAAEELRAGWRFDVINGRELPLELVIVGAMTRNSYSCTQCCCDKCRRPIPHEFGAYRQLIVGLLGTQSTGKTTYLATLTDAINVGEVTTMVQSNGDQLLARTQIKPAISNDSQWTRVRQSMDSDGKAGALWMYEHGLPPAKTKVGELEAPALTFLVSAEGKEAVMYVLADIPGEAFSNTISGNYDPALVRKVTVLLQSCDAFVMVINRQQMKDAETTMDAENMTPGQVLDCYKDFMPQVPVPTAVVVTAADLINHGNLRQPLNLAYDMRNLSPLVWSEQAGALVYNTEAMHGASQAVWKYVDKQFGTFLTQLVTVFKEKYGQKLPTLAAFAVSNGTQCAPKSYLDASGRGENPEDADPEYLTNDQMTARYQQMQKERFGVAAPILWLLACNGMLEVDGAEGRKKSAKLRLIP